MKAIEQFDRLKKINEKIIEGSTGTPKEFSEYLAISQDHLTTLIKKLKAIGVPVKYSHKRKTYYYPPGTRLVVEYSLVLENVDWIGNLKMS